MVTAATLERSQQLFTLYTLVYPLCWLVSRLDVLLWWRSGYTLIVSAQNLKAAPIEMFVVDAHATATP